jgi:hypothetical protein
VVTRRLGTGFAKNTGMDSISPVWLLLAVFVCSMIGRFMLIRAAWEISKPWGLSVLCVPFAPMVFRMKYKELAGEGQNWRTATMICGVAFMAVTGSTGSLDDLWEIVPPRWRPAEYGGYRTPEGLSEAARTALYEEAGDSAGATAPGSVPPESAAPPKRGFLARIAARVRPAEQAVAPAATLPVSSPALATLAPLTNLQSVAQRVAANQAEFARLGEVYELLRKEKGYLKKWDQEAIAAYNAEAAKYQTALAAARAEQVELNRSAALAKK